MFARIKDHDKDKTTFTSHLGTYRYTRMSFDLLKWACCVATHNIYLPIWSLIKKTCLVFINDVVFFSKNNWQRVKDINKGTLLCQAIVTLKLSKCRFFQENIEYLGQILLHVWLNAVTKTFDAMKTSIFLTESTQMRSLFGACNVYKRFIE